MIKWRYLIGWFAVIFSLTGLGVGLYFLYDAGYSLVLVIFIAFYSISLYCSILIFIQNRQLIGKLTWMLSFMIFPIIAPTAFILFGQRYKGRMTLEKYRSKRTFEKEIMGIDHSGSEEASIINQQSHIANRGVYNVDAQMFRDGDEGYKKLFDDLENAKEFIHLQYYIIKPGEIFDHLKDILIRKAAEGVEVRFIVDDFGRWAVPWYEIKDLMKKGVRIERYAKVQFPFISSYNVYRMHRKVAIIDGKIAHTGGLNIADEYSNISKKFGLWIDYQIRYEGAAVRSYSLLFMDDWEHITKEKLDFDKYLKEENKGESKFVLTEDSPEVLEPIIETSIINLISNAKKEIILTTPYLVPTPELFSALRMAAMKGVKVKIIIPGKPDKKVVIIATKYIAHELQKYGVEIYQAKNLLIHSKIGIFDRKYAYTGTVNLDTRSLYGQWEAIQTLTGPIVEQVGDTIDYYLQFTRKLSFEELSTSKIKSKVIRAYVNFFSPIM